MVTLWCTSSRSFMPRRIAVASLTLGSATVTGWKRRWSAASFSKYFRYSFSVVAPIACSSPRARAGFRMFAASIEPSLAPAPTMVWISSMKSTTFAAFTTSFMTALSLSSNSPRYFAPAISALISSAMTRLFCRLSGTSFLAISWARPSTTAVFPTPGSPSRIGLFFVLRIKICIIREITSSRPMTGSSSPAIALAVRSTPNLLSASSVSSAVCESMLLPPRSASSSFLISLRSANLDRIFFSGSAFKFAISQVSTAINLSPELAISPFATSSEFISSREIRTFSFVTFELVGKFEISLLISSSTAVFSMLNLLKIWFSTEPLSATKAQSMCNTPTSLFLEWIAKETLLSSKERILSVKISIVSFINFLLKLKLVALYNFSVFMSRFFSEILKFSA